jgi:hypothetical protein
MLLRLAAVFAVVAGLMFGRAAFAQTAAEQRYLATRDAAIVAVKVADDRKEPIVEIDKRMEGALAELQQQLHAIVGPVAVTGVGGEGKLHLDTLSQGDVGFGALDALDFASADGKVTVTVTTVNLLRHWWEKNLVNVPQEMEAALKSDAFYTQALSQDSAIMRYADLPLKRPRSAALALLAASTQDQAPASADDIYVAAVRKGRVYILHAAAKRKLGPIASCDAARKRYDARGNAEPDADRRLALQARSEDEFRRCFAREAPKQPGFDALVKEARALLTRLPL